MSRKFLVSIDLNKNELQNATIQNLAVAPASPNAGQIYFNTASNTLYFYNGTSWVDVYQNSTISYDTFSNRPAAGAGNAGTLFFATDQQLLYLSNGSSWLQVSNFGSVTSATSYGDIAGNGSSNNYARADHSHGTPSLTSTPPQSLSVGGTNSVGTASTPARADHVHALPSFGSVTAQTTFGASSADGSGSSFARNDHTHGTPTHDNSAHSAINLSALAVPTANISFANYKITNLAEPSSSSDAATKNYVDTTAQGLNIHASVIAGTTANLTATYNNGSSGVGATLTNSGSQSAFSIDGISPTAGQRVLIKNQTTSSQNGIYTVTTVGSGSTNWVLTRAVDFDQPAEIGGGDFVFIESGTVNDNTGYVCIDSVTTVGTDPIVFTQFSGAGTYLAGNGLTLAGNTFSVNAGTGITTAGGTTAIDTSVVVRKYAANVGDGSSTTITVTHSLNTRDVTVAVYDNSSPYGEVVCDVNHTSTSAISLVFSTAPTSNQYRVVVQG